MAKSHTGDSSEPKSSSTSQVLTAVISNGVIFAVFFSIFAILRLRKKFNRIYAPKSSFNIINDEKKPDPLPRGLLNWILPLIKKSDNFVIQQAGIDGFFFLRYLLIMCLYFGVSMIYLFVILFPINASNGNHDKGPDQLAYSNVKHKGRYFAHAFLSWIFFWSFLFVVYRELIYYTSMREAILATPRYAKKLSSRTVLFQTVPQDYLNEKEFAKLFVGVNKVWIARADPELITKVNKRDQMAMNLENTITGFIKNTVSSIYKKNIKDHKKESQDLQIKNLNITNNIMDYNKKEPQHKLKFLFGRKVDSIPYFKEELPKLNDEVNDLQQRHNEAKPWNSVFVEFESQYQAQMAYQSIPHSVALQLNPSIIGVESTDVVWFNMRMLWWERITRKFGAVSAIVALVLLWAIPVAFVGMISNINYLVKLLPWLEFLTHLPPDLEGLLTSLAPTVALAVLMMLLPIFIRKMAVTAGAPSAVYVEYFTQQAYFAFQVIQVFLVTTIASAATAVVKKIIDKPTSAMSVLAANLPKSSNFFIAYVILQGFSISSGAVAQVVPLVVFHLLGFLLDKTPRKKFNRFTGLSSMSWGTTFPVYTNLAVIIFAYGIISPLILLFGFVTFALLYVAYLYNLCYVNKESPDGRGMYYPRALFQTLVGLYLGQVCLLGLFVVGKGWGPIVLEIICLAVTAFIHVNLSAAFDNLTKVVPVDCMKPLDGKSETPSFKNIYNKDDETLAKDDIKELPSFQIKKFQPKSGVTIKDQQTTSVLSDYTYELQHQTQQQASGVMPFEDEDNNVVSVPLLADGDISPVPEAPYWKRFLQPHIYASYKVAKTKLPEIYQLKDPNEPVDQVHAYNLPSVSAKCPVVWIPRDPYGFSTVLIQELKNCNIEASDEGAFFNEEGKLVWEVTSVPPEVGHHDELDLKEEDLKVEDSRLQDSKSNENPFE